MTHILHTKDTVSSSGTCKTRNRKPCYNDLHMLMCMCRSGDADETSKPPWILGREQEFKHELIEVQWWDRPQQPAKPRPSLSLSKLFRPIQRQRSYANVQERLLDDVEAQSAKERRQRESQSLIVKVGDSGVVSADLVSIRTDKELDMHVSDGRVRKTKSQTPPVLIHPSS
jgi:hypothetical protein